MKISNVNIYGLENAILTSRYPMVADTEEFWNNISCEGLKLWLDNGLSEIYNILNKKPEKYKLKDDIVYMKVKDKKAMISPQDLPKVDKYEWNYIDQGGYVKETVNGYHLHKVICDLTDDVVDHIDRNKLNCTRNNLRICSHQQNSINTNIPKNNTSGIIGVSFSKEKNKWRANININRKQLHLGYFNNIEDAIQSRLIAEKTYFGEFAPQRHMFKQYDIEEEVENHISKYPNITEYLRAYKNLLKLSHTKGAEGHDQALTGITVTFDMTCSIQLWQEAERYRFLYFVSSTSKMHRLHQMNIDKCCNEYVDNRIKDIVNDKQDKYLEALELQKEGKMDTDEVKKCFYELVYNVPSGFEYTAGMITNYRQLKTIYHQRKNH